MKISCLCIGPAGSGKTLLLRKLQGTHEIDETTSSVPTTGTSLYKIKFKNKTITLREMGGFVAPLWCHYYKDIKKVLYVIDASNLCHISAAGVLFYTMLTEEELKYAKILLVLSKMDISYRQMKNEALLIFQIEKLKTQVTQEIQIVEFSAINGTGVPQILTWLEVDI